MRGLIYKRVSTDEQAIEGFSLAAQEEMCLERALADGCTTVEVFCDDGYSAATMERPALQQLLSTMRKGDTIYVYRLDRLSRDVEHMAVILKLCQTRGVKIVPLIGSADVSTSLGRAFTNMQAVWAQLEREQIAERVSMGMRRRVEEGKPYSRVPYGLTSDGEKWGVNEDEAKVVRRIFELRAAGYGLATICKTLAEEGLPNKEGQGWRSRAIWHILHNRAYVGELCFGDIHRPNAIPAIIDYGLWNRAQAINDARRRSRSRPESQYLLSGLVFCECGRKMGGYIAWTYKRKDGTYLKYPAYRCSGRGNIPTFDHNNVVIAKKLDELILRYVTDEAFNENVELILPPVDSKSYSKKLAELSTELENLEIALLQGRITGERFDKHKARIEAAIADIRRKQTEERDSEAAARTALGLIRERLGVDALQFYQTKGPTPELKAALWAVIDRIIVSKPDGNRRGLDSRRITLCLRSSIVR